MKKLTFTTLLLISLSISIYCQNEWELLIGNENSIRGNDGVIINSNDLVIWGSSLQNKQQKLETKFSKDNKIKIDSTSSFIGKESFLINIDSNGKIKYEKSIGEFGLTNAPNLYGRRKGKITHPLHGKIYAKDNNELLLKSNSSIGELQSLQNADIKELNNLAGGIALDYIPFYKSSHIVGFSDLNNIGLDYVDSLGRDIWKNYYLLFDSVGLSSPNYLVKKKIGDKEIIGFKTLDIKNTHSNHIIMVSAVFIGMGGQEFYPIITKLNDNGSVLWSKLYIGFQMDAFYNDVSITPNNNIIICSRMRQTMKVDENGHVVWGKKINNINCLNNIIQSNEETFSIGGFVNVEDSFKPIIFNFDSLGQVIGGEYFNTSYSIKTKGAKFLKTQDNFRFLLGTQNSSTFGKEWAGIVVVGKEAVNSQEQFFSSYFTTDNISILEEDVFLHQLKLSYDEVEEIFKINLVSNKNFDFSVKLTKFKEDGNSSYKIFEETFNKVDNEEILIPISSVDGNEYLSIRLNGKVNYVSRKLKELIE